MFRLFLSHWYLCLSAVHCSLANVYNNFKSYCVIEMRLYSTKHGLELDQWICGADILADISLLQIHCIGISKYFLAINNKELQCWHDNDMLCLCCGFWTLKHWYWYRLQKSSISLCIKFSWYYQWSLITTCVKMSSNIVKYLQHTTCSKTLQLH